MMVTCVTPTFNRRHFFPQAIRCFLRQDYPELEWIILDDGSETIADLLPADSRIRYSKVRGRMTYGAKLNAIASEASGEILIHVDDDDIYQPDRVSRQVNPLLADPSLLVSGTSTLYYRRGREAFQYVGSKSIWLGGIAYRKSEWNKRPFDEKAEPGADQRWLHGVPINARCDLSDPSLIVATIHGENHSPKNPIGRWWKPRPWPVVSRLLEAKE